MTQDSGRDPLGMFSCQDTFIKADSQVNSKYPLIYPCWTLSSIEHLGFRVVVVVNCQLFFT